MAHRRAELRRLVVARLKAFATAAGNQVYGGRFQAANEDELYAGGVIFVYTMEEMIPRFQYREREDPYPASNWGSILHRDLHLEIHVLVPAFLDETPDTADYNDDALAVVDELSADVERALESWEPEGFETAFVRLRESKTDVTTNEGGMPVARCVMDYWIDYVTTYRPCSDPLVDNDAADLLMRGLYPGGQVVEGCPADQIGEVCPVGGANVVAVRVMEPPP